MNKITSGDTTSKSLMDGKPGSEGGSLFVPIELGPGKSCSITVRLAWYVPFTHQRIAGPKAQACNCDSGECQESLAQYYRPWHAS